MDTLSPEQRAAVTRRLEFGERLLWGAGASPGMQAGALAPGCVGIPFLLFGAVPLWIAIRNMGDMPAQQNGPLFFTIFVVFGLLFTGVGVLTIRHAVTLRRDLRATIWAVTDRRLLKLVERPGRRVQEAVPLRLVTGVDVVEYDDGSGSLTLTTGAPRTPGSRGARRGQYQILGVKDAAAARRLIQAQVDRAVAAEPS